MAGSYLSLLLYLVLLGRINAGIVPLDANNHWISPPGPEAAGDYQDNPNYTVGRTIQLLWQTDFTKLSLILTHGFIDEPGYVQPVNLNTFADVPSAYSWTVPDPEKVGFNLSHGNVFYLAVEDPTTKAMFTCHYFNITDSNTVTATSSTSPANAIPTNFSVTTPPIRPSSTSSTSIFPTSISPTTTTPSATSTNSSGLSKGTKVGVGVGIGTGAFVLVGIGVMLGLVIRQRSHEGVQTDSSPSKHREGYDVASEMAGMRAYDTNAQHELSSHTMVEMPSLLNLANCKAVNLLEVSTLTESLFLNRKLLKNLPYLNIVQACMNSNMSYIFV
ncbi:hypothetical protein K461DRAFT_319052 [Myriangium duriaei CBS 260.36]|uniref:Mid2 domain-containing protein n=1 Tax=Myriangium duriaei CBS 260.36 TaxID=1168546 RepID=A0A9P4J707_9PEZI|nr:hypothetical protein K461DRAFT_319052 [Myriangium duriaei CBS 260.36]